MAGLMAVPVIGIVENMSYFICDKCGEKHEIFGKSNIEEIAGKYGIETISKLPIDSSIAKTCDEGCIELIEGDWLDNMMDAVERI